jgi:hypothetical protein
MYIYLGVSIETYSHTVGFTIVPPINVEYTFRAGLVSGCYQIVVVYKYYLGAICRLYIFISVYNYTGEHLFG